MKRMFATQILTRQIMLLHANVPDLLHVCRLVYGEGKAQSVECPLQRQCRAVYAALNDSSSTIF